MRILPPYLCLILMAFALVSHGHAATCKSYSSCAQAVKNWCAGNHPRADGDNDGIPCENVCKSLKDVKALKREFSCKFPNG